MSNDEQIARTILRVLFSKLRDHYWYIMSVPGLGKAESEEDVLELIFSVGECSLRFFKLLDYDYITRSVDVIPSNGIDCIVDHALSNPSIAEDDFEEVMGLVDDFVEQLQE